MPETAQTSEGQKKVCSMCGTAGWIFDFRTNKPGPLMLELIPCIHPECEHSGREVQNICFKGVQFNHICLHPKDGWVMSVSDPTYEEWVQRAA